MIRGRREIYLPHRLDRRRLYILPTRYGLLFIVLLTAMLIGSTNYNNNLGFLLTFMLGSMGLIALVHTYLNLVGIRIMSIGARPVFAGQTVRFDIRVRAGKRNRVGIRFSFPQGASTDAERLPAAGDETVQIPLPALRRGFLRPGPLRISTLFPTGLFVAWYEFRTDAACPVYPHPLTARVNSVMQMAGNGEQEDVGGKGVDDFEGLKPYQPGDPLRHISWKAYAKGKGLYSKSFSGLTGSVRMIDWDELVEKDMEKRLSILCGLVLKAHGEKQEYGLKLPGSFIEPAWSDAHKHKCLLALAIFGKK